VREGGIREGEGFRELTVKSEDHSNAYKYKKIFIDPICVVDFEKTIPDGNLVESGFEYPRRKYAVIFSGKLKLI